MKMKKILRYYRKAINTKCYFYLTVCATVEEGHAIPSEQRTTTPYMTKYERARVLGTRALQIRYNQFRRTLYIVVIVTIEICMLFMSL